MDDLRAMTTTELYIYSGFYSKHPYFQTAYEKYGARLTNCVNNLVHLSSSVDTSFDAKTCGDIVKHEAILNCVDHKWSSFLCMLALASVIGLKITSYYPDNGEEKYKLLFNGTIQPRYLHKDNEFHILFCYQGYNTKFFRPNHYVPIAFGSNPIKRKNCSIPEQKKTKRKKIFCHGLFL